MFTIRSFFLPFLKFGSLTVWTVQVVAVGGVVTLGSAVSPTVSLARNDSGIGNKQWSASSTLLRRPTPTSDTCLRHRSGWTGDLLRPELR